MSENLQKAIALVEEAREMIQSEIREASPKPELLDHEYATFRVADTYITDDKGQHHAVSHLPDEPIPPGESRNITFGVEYVINKGVVGIPESVVHSFGIDHPFLFERLTIDDACADKITITGMFNGANSFFHPSCRIPGHRFAASNENPPIFKKTIHYGITFIVFVQNTSTEPCAFKAKLVGKVPADNEGAKKVFLDALSQDDSMGVFA